MTPEKKSFRQKNPGLNLFLYRLSQFVGLLLGVKFLLVFVLTFALYVSTFFLFNQEESLRNFVFDFKVHGIIFCTVLSILAGGIINQFYDKEKDKVTKPFRTRIQSFLKQRYYLYTYLSLNVLSLVIAGLISSRVLFYLIFYQFGLWFYSHKLSKILIVKNLTFVSLTLYPFFGMLVYYRTFSTKILWMAVFLFLILLLMDVLKDTLTKNADRIFNYRTIPNSFSEKTTHFILSVLTLSLFVSAMILVEIKGLQSAMSYYFLASLFLLGLVLNLILSQLRNSNFFALNLLRLWLFLGILTMLWDGIFTKFVR